MGGTDEPPNRDPANKALTELAPNRTPPKPAVEPALYCTLCPAQFLYLTLRHTKIGVASPLSRIILKRFLSRIILKLTARPHQP